MRNKVIIIGAGPGGLSCATYLQRLGISSVVIYKTFGGKQNYYQNIYGLYPENHLTTESFLQSQKDSLNTAILGGEFEATVSIVQSNVTSMSKKEDGNFEINCEGNQAYFSDVVVLATGTDVSIPDSISSVLDNYLTFRNYPFPDLKQSDSVLILGAGYTSAEITNIIAEKVASILVLDVSKENYQMLSPSRLKQVKYCKNTKVIFDKDYILSDGCVTYHCNKNKINYNFDKAILCTGEKANVDFLPVNLLNPQTRKIEILSNPEIFEINMSAKWKGLFAIGDAKNDRLTSYIDYAIADGMRTAQSIYRYIKRNNADIKQ